MAVVYACYRIGRSLLDKPNQERASALPAPEALHLRFAPMRGLQQSALADKGSDFCSAAGTLTATRVVQEPKRRT